MKICILTPRFPFPQYGGDALRINEIARYLKTKGHRLVLVSLSDEKETPVEVAKTLYDEVYYVKRNKIMSWINCALGYFKGTPLQCSYYYSKAYLNLLKKVIKKDKPDLFVSHLLRMTPYLEELGLESQSIVEMTDALSKTYDLSSNAKGVGMLKYIYMIERNLIKKYEQHVIRRFPKVVLVSQADVDLLAKDARDASKSLAVYTNGVSCSENHKNRIVDKNKICFMGNMRSIQNQDAALHFTNDIFPLIKKSISSAKFYIVGSLPPQNIQDLASDDIIVTGFIDDLEEFIGTSSITVAPVRIAAGIQNKVLVAMGCGVPVVLTPLISGAIPEIQHDVNAIVADNPVQIARYCIELMQNEQKRCAIAQAGYDMVVRNYSWNEKLQGYEQL